jgi:phosphoglycolate phosphatase
MIKVLIFDLDGTLVNAYPAVSRSVNHTLKALGLPSRTHEEIKRSVGGGDRKLMVHFAGEARAARALKLYRPHHAKALQVQNGVKLLAGALGVLKFFKAKGVKLAIASNRPTRFTRIILTELDILKCFDAVLCADRAPKPKPNPDILWALASRFKVKKTEVLYVGDMTIDINCGRRAGIRVVAVATGSNSKKELKDLKPLAVIDKIGELKTMEGI